MTECPADAEERNDLRSLGQAPTIVYSEPCLLVIVASTDSASAVSLMSVREIRASAHSDLWGPVPANRPVARPSEATRRLRHRSTTERLGRATQDLPGSQIGRSVADDAAEHGSGVRFPKSTWVAKMLRWKALPPMYLVCSLLHCGRFDHFEPVHDIGPRRRPEAPSSVPARCDGAVTAP